MIESYSSQRNLIIWFLIEASSCRRRWFTGTFNQQTGKSKNFKKRQNFLRHRNMQNFFIMPCVTSKRRFGLPKGRLPRFVWSIFYDVVEVWMRGDERQLYLNVRESVVHPDLVIQMISDVRSEVSTNHSNLCWGDGPSSQRSNTKYHRSDAHSRLVHSPSLFVACFGPTTVWRVARGIQHLKSLTFSLHSPISRPKHSWFGRKLRVSS